MPNHRLTLPARGPKPAVPLAVAGLATAAALGSVLVVGLAGSQAEAEPAHPGPGSLCVASGSEPCAPVETLPPAPGSPDAEAILRHQGESAGAAAGWLCECETAPEPER